VQIDGRYLGHNGDVAYNESVSYEEQLSAWKRWAEVCTLHGTPTIVQINHPGRQSPPFAGSKGFWDKTISSSAVPMSLGNGCLPAVLGRLVFGTPKEMTKEDIQHVVQGFAKTAKLAAEAGFAGAEIHGAHGYLIDQFMSEMVNQRTDEYGGSPANRVRIVIEIIEAIRAVVPASFCIGIKFNSVDHQSEERLRECVEGLKVSERRQLRKPPGKEHPPFRCA
jgi:2,4-dienoyl-CoA reductase-like NADH-dependent reductase (Old Yellow Enzyme family)